MKAGEVRIWRGRVWSGLNPWYPICEYGLQSKVLPYCTVRTLWNGSHYSLTPCSAIHYFFSWMGILTFLKIIIDWILCSLQVGHSVYGIWTATALFLCQALHIFSNTTLQGSKNGIVVWKLILIQLDVMEQHSLLGILKVKLVRVWKAS